MNSNTTHISLEFAQAQHSNVAKTTPLLWAVICSVLLHVCLAFIIPKVSFEKVKKPDLLEVKLVKKEAPAPTPIVLPPEPIKPQTRPELQPVTKIKSLPMPQVVEKTPIVITPPPSQIVAPTEVMAVKPSPDAPPSIVPPAPVVAPPPPTPNTADMDDARSRYGNALWGAIERHKKYPRIAQMRGWQGEVVLELLLDGSGQLKSKKILVSSGYDVLDKQALDMVEKAAPFPPPPDALRGSQFSIKVPIPFKLESE